MGAKYAMQIPAAKTLLRRSYKIAVGLHAVCSGLLRSRSPNPRIFYGGARTGHAGGARVKVSRLNEFFPEHRWSYNLIYCLSNTPYIPGYALRLQKHRGIPIVLNQSGAFYAGWFNGDCQGHNAEMAHAYHLADHIFWQSEFSRVSTRKFLGEREGPGEVLYNAIDTEHFRPLKKAEESRNNQFRFLVSGKTDLHLIYRIESAVNGLAHVRKQGLEASMTIAGVMSSETKTRIQHLVSDLGLLKYISFHGPYTQEQAPTLYNSCDAYILLTHNDVCPNSALEAMSCGLPVIHASTGGTPELVGQTGFRIETAESWDQPSVPVASDVAQAMMTVANSRKALSALARQRAVDKFDVKHWIQRHAEVFEKLLMERS